MAFEVLADLGIDDIPKYFWFREFEWQGIKGIMSRTGYTGERGVEFYIPNENALDLWTKLLAHESVEAAGLGARDTLRLEMAYPLYGHELNEKRSPIEAGFSMMMNKERSYIGSDSLKKDYPERLFAIAFEGRRAAREGASILLNGEEISTVCSGSFSPSLNTAIALAYLPSSQISEGDSLEAKVGSKTIPGKVVSIPFYKEGTCRK